MYFYFTNNIHFQIAVRWTCKVDHFFLCICNQM